MRDEALREMLQQKLDSELDFLTFTPSRQEALFESITGGKPMKKTIRISLGLAVAIVLLLAAIGAVAAMLLSAQEVIEKNAVPMAIENDTEARKVESYTHAQLVELIRSANENGITLDESTGIMQALKKGEGYWEDEAIMEICREAFGGVIDEWTYDEQYWYLGLMAQMNGEENTMDYPGEGDMAAEDAREAAEKLVTAACPGAGIDDAALYRRKETFFKTDAGSIWQFTYMPLDLDHPKFVIQVDQDGKAVSLEETPRDWKLFSVGTLDYAVSTSYRARTYTKATWSQEAWHAFSEKLPLADRTQGWSREYDAYLRCAYPLPDENDLSSQEAQAIAEKDAGGEKAVVWEKVLLSDGERRIWKLTSAVQDKSTLRTYECSWEIDAKTGEILRKIAWQTGDPRWMAYVLQAVYEEITAGMLTGAQAAELAQEALRRELGDDSIPFTDPEQFEQRISFMEGRNAWRVWFQTRTLSFGSATAWVSEPEHQVTIESAEPAQVSGDTLYARYKQVYGVSRWTQDIWVRFSMDMAQYEPQGWEGRLLKKTVYPAESEVSMTREKAVDIAIAHNETKEEAELDATLIGALPHPVWKVVLSGEIALWLYEIDAETGEVLDKEIYKPDDYLFDNPIKRYTLHRDFAPAYVQEFGMEALAAVEVVKAFGDLSYDEPMMPDVEAGEDGVLISDYEETSSGRTVTFRPPQPGLAGYRVTFGEDWLTEKVEILAAGE